MWVEPRHHLSRPVPVYSLHHAEVHDDGDALIASYDDILWAQVVMTKPLDYDVRGASSSAGGTHSGNLGQELLGNAIRNSQ